MEPLLGVITATLIIFLIAYCCTDHRKHVELNTILVPDGIFIDSFKHWLEYKGLHIKVNTTAITHYYMNMFMNDEKYFEFIDHVVDTTIGPYEDELRTEPIYGKLLYKGTFRDIVPYGKGRVYSDDESIYEDVVCRNGVIVS